MSLLTSPNDRARALPEPFTGRKEGWRTGASGGERLPEPQKPFQRSVMGCGLQISNTKKHPTGCSRRLGILGTLGQSVSYKTATFGELALNAGGGYELADINSPQPAATLRPPRHAPATPPHAASRPHRHRHAPAAPPRAASRPHRHRHAPATTPHPALMLARDHPLRSSVMDRGLRRLTPSTSSWRCRCGRRRSGLPGPSACSCVSWPLCRWR